MIDEENTVGTLSLCTFLHPFLTSSPLISNFLNALSIKKILDYAFISDIFNKSLH
jgi:hypothetical protein